MSLYNIWLGESIYCLYLGLLGKASKGFTPIRWFVGSTLLTHVWMPWIKEVVLMTETSTVSVDRGMLRVGGEDILFVCQAVFPIFAQINVNMRRPTTLLSTET